MDGLAPARDAEPVGLGGRGRDPLADPEGRDPKKKSGRLIGLSVPEVRKLLLKLVWNWVPEAGRVLAWSE